MRESGVHVFTMKDIDRLGIATVAERAVEIASAGTAGIRRSVFDLDGLRGPGHCAWRRHGAWRPRLPRGAW
ncbi:MAG: hypothetical protein U0Q11_13980 [Vicinamibacterales bacterium]